MKSIYNGRTKTYMAEISYSDVWYVLRDVERRHPRARKPRYYYRLLRVDTLVDVEQKLFEHVVIGCLAVGHVYYDIKTRCVLYIQNHKHCA
jgi:hypothetical protein